MSLVESISEVNDQIHEFYSKEYLWKDALGPHPRYFLFIRTEDGVAFGLSKFCAIKGITLEDYCGGLRNEYNGGVNQKLLSSLLNENWVEFGDIDPLIKGEFEAWINRIGKSYQGFEKNKFIDATGKLSLPDKVRQAVRKRELTPEQLEAILMRCKTNGDLAERIAIDYEKKRLRNLGLVDFTVTWTSKVNVAAGYDIESETKNESRKIEVKSYDPKRGTIYLTRNEIDVLKTMSENGFIYLVDIKSEEVNEIRNPIPKLDDITPILFQVSLS